MAQRYARNSEQGSILIMTALSLVILLGVTALAVDTSYMFDYRNRMAAAADAAALAGARAKKAGYTGTNLIRFAQNQAYLNGFQHGANNVSVSINNGPASGPFAGNTAYVEAIITRATPTFFARVLGRSSLTVTARAVAGTGPVPLANIIALCKTGATTYDYTDCEGIEVTATTSITANSGIINNSKDHDGFVLGSQSIMQATDFAISDPWSETTRCTSDVAGTSGINCRTVAGSTNTTGIVHYGAEPTADPLQGLAVPSCGSPCANIYTADVVCNPICSSTGTNVVQPGEYQRKITLGSGTVYMNGVVYKSTGASDFLFTGSGTDKVYVCGYGPTLPAGCTNTGGVTLAITGTGNLKIQTGVVLRARSDQILVYQANNQPMVVGGGAGIDISGVIYAPLASVSFTGGSTGTTISTTSFIVHDFSLGGSGGGIIFNAVSMSSNGPVVLSE
jgi:Flp pilus assembly protein TadG